MRRWRDIGSEMFEPALDGRTEERMFRGLLEPHEAPAGFGGAAAVLRWAATTAFAEAAIPTDPARKQRIVASMVSIISSEHPSRTSVAVPPPTLRAGSRRGPVPFLPRLRLVAALVATFLFASMGLAFAGALPGSAQTVASSLLAHVGIHVPKGHGATPTPNGGSTGSGGAPTTGPGAGHAKGPTATGPVLNGHHGHDHGRGHGRDHRHGDSGHGNGRDHRHGDHGRYGDHGDNGDGRNGKGHTAGGNGHQGYGHGGDGGTDGHGHTGDHHGSGHGPAGKDLAWT